MPELDEVIPQLDSVQSPHEMEMRLFVPHVVDLDGVFLGEPRLEQFFSGHWRPIPLVYENTSRLWAEKG